VDDIPFFFDTLLQGIKFGSVYASLALAIVIVYRTSGLLNFAQGEMAMFSVFLTWQFAAVWGLPIGLAWLAAIACSFVMGAVIERLVIRPVSDHPAGPLAVVIVSIGLFLGFNGLAGYLWGRTGEVLPNPFPATTWDIGGVAVTATIVGSVLVLAVEVVALWFLFQKTKLGLGMRAVASSKESSRLAGVRVGTMLLVGWGLAAAVGTVAGVLQAASIPGNAFDPNLMVGTLVYAFAAATLGGFDSPVGAVVGGLVVGITRMFAQQYVGWIGSDLAVASAFALILVVLLVRPQGLFGRVEVTRV
jgi:branched-chain amino acid transport system permease protein